MGGGTFAVRDATCAFASGPSRLPLISSSCTKSKCPMISRTGGIMAGRRAGRNSSAIGERSEDEKTRRRENGTSANPSSRSLVFPSSLVTNPSVIPVDGRAHEHEHRAEDSVEQARLARGHRGAVGHDIV